MASFVIPAFNAAGTLEETVRSALAQTCAEIEVVLVDDGSSDPTLEVARALASRDPRVHALSQGNAGPAAARNRGTREGSAPYVCFLDADDLVSANKVEVQAAILDRDPGVSVVYSSASTFSDELAAVREPFPTCTSGAKLAEGLLAGGLAFPIHAALVRKSAWESVGGFRKVFVVEDTDLWTRLAVAGARFEYEDRTHALYRRPPSARSRNLVSVVRGRLAILDWLLAQDDSRVRANRECLRGRKRYQSHLLAGFLARAGSPVQARAAALSALRWGLRPGHVWDVLRLLGNPTLLLDRVESGTTPAGGP